jgi:hypothetical protein
LARAEDLFEIQVYEGDHHPPGEAGLELHLNWTPRGSTTAASPAEVPPDGAFRVTLEPSLGVTDWLELGAYLETFTAPGAGAAWGGYKLRAKLVVPGQAGLPFRLGLNVELANLPPTVDPARWSLEVRPILAWEVGRWVLAVNPIIAVPLSGPDGGRADFEPAAKVRWDTRRGVAVGFEYYAGLGPLRDLEPLSSQSHLLVAAVDLAPVPGAEDGPWELNLGVGAGLTSATPQQWVLKAILGRTF